MSLSKKKINEMLLTVSEIANLYNFLKSCKVGNGNFNIPMLQKVNI